MTSNGDAARRYVVVDASVSLKWALDDEESVSEAIALRNDAVLGRFLLAAPSLWSYEVCNALVVAVRRGRITPAAGIEALSHLHDLGIHFADPSTSDVFTAGVRYGISAYDAAYLALAQTLETELWTGDLRLIEAVRDSVGFIRWIGDFKAAT